MAPVDFDGHGYVLLVAQEGQRTELEVQTARSWIDAGASYICSWGRATQDVEDIFDHASFLEEVGPPLPFTLMTTSHNDGLEEALWFAFYCATPPHDLARPLDRVVLVVNTHRLRERCVNWISTNEASAAR